MGGQQRLDVHPGGLQQPPVADQHLFSVHGGADALAGDRLEPGHVGQPESPLDGTGDDRGRERVFGGTFDGRNGSQ